MAPEGLAVNVDIKPPPFETFILALPGPVDLTANATILPAAPDLTPLQTAPRDADSYGTREVFCQCVAGSARWRETAAEPAADAAGHMLGLGDGVIVAVAHGRPFWFWPAADGTQLAISPASGAPTRETGGDYTVPPAAA